MVRDAVGTMDLGEEAGVRRKSLALLLTIALVFVGLVTLIGVARPRSLLRMATNYLPRAQYYAESYLQARTMQHSSPQDLGPAAPITPTPTIKEMLAEVNRDRALTDLRRLTGEEPICSGADCYTIANRATGSEGLHRATDYVASSLASLGYSVSFRNWSRSGYSDRNVIAKKPGAYAPNEEIYFVAHVDGVGSGAGERFPAADDDGSGTVDLVEVARIFSSHTFSRTLVLLFTTGEEEGTLGVQSYLSQLSTSELSSIKMAVDVDVIGYDGNRDGVMELWHGGDVPSMAVTQMMSDTIKAYQLDLVPQFVVGCG
jgi:Peptidase family M28